MSRTPSQTRYKVKQEMVLPGVRVRKDEAAYIKKLKGARGLSWLEIVYRGLGIRREDYLNSRKKQD